MVMRVERRSVGSILILRSILSAAGGWCGREWCGVWGDEAGDVIDRRGMPGLRARFAGPNGSVLARR